MTHGECGIGKKVEERHWKRMEWRVSRERRMGNKRGDQGRRKPPCKEMDPEHMAWKNSK